MATVQLQLAEESPSRLSEYAAVPIAFEVTKRFNVLPLDGGLGGFALDACEVEPAYVKDYDRLRGHRPSEWAARWDLGKWWFAAAFLEGRRVGGVAVVIDASEVEGAIARADVATLWDIRVSPDCRRQGVGSQMIAYAERHVRARGIRHLKLETQNVNVAACRFYARAGYVLRGIDRFAYAELPEEVQLVWQKDLSGH